MFTHIDHDRIFIDNLPANIPAIGANGLRYPDHWEEFYRPFGYRHAVPFVVPSGMVRVEDSRTIIDDGDTITETFDTITQAEAEAAAAEREEAAKQQQALEDVVNHGADLQAIVEALGAFPEGVILPGMDYPAIEEALNSHIKVAQPDAQPLLIAASLRAMSIYDRLCAHGITTADRFWRALGALQA